MAKKKQTAKKIRAKASPTSFQPRVPRPRRWLAIPMLAVALVYLVAMLDFEPAQAPQRAALEEQPSNVAGAAGLYLAYGSIWAFGLAAWALPLALVRIGWQLFTGTATRLRFSVVVASIGLVAGLAGIAQMFEEGWLLEDAPVLVDSREVTVHERQPPRADRVYFHGRGGEVGQTLTSPALRNAIGPAGISVLLACLTLSSGFWVFRDSFMRWRGRVATWRAKQKEDAEARKKAQEEAAAAKAREAELERVRQNASKPPPTKQAPKMEIPKAEPKEDEKKKRRPAPPKLEDLTGEERLPAPKDEPAPALKGEAKIIQPEAIEKAAVELPKARGDYTFPSLDLLQDPPPPDSAPDASEYEALMAKLIHTLDQFKVKVEPGEIHTGPVITRYEVIPAAGVRVEKIANLDKNIALGLKALAVRILAPVPGKGSVGIEVPNPKPQPVCLREIVESAAWVKANKEIPVVLGKDVTGRPIVEDLTRMPHMLIAGATGSGKTVCINTVIASLLYHSGPDDLRFIMVDPKVVEMQQYNALPHMLIPVVTEPKKVPGALKYLIGEMERRYQVFAEAGVRNIAGFNAKLAKDKEEKARAEALDKELSGAMSAEERNAMIEVKRDRNVVMETPDKKMPYIVCIIDELADLMMVAPADIEAGIARLAQLARAAGIHLILATQRPSVNVITGVIKANLPTRISFKVSSQVDSRTILDQKGAETLIGKGDMLYVPPGASNIVRAQGAFVSDDEINRIVDYLKENNEPPEFDEAVQAQVEASVEDGDRSGDDFALESDDSGDVALKKRALEVIKATKRASTSSIQRRLKIGYNRAARIMDELEEDGIVGPDNGSKPRELLVDVESL
ncbi:MAG: DNA translocase FtsK 4TM domain-containing protein [Opitutales bacterium]